MTKVVRSDRENTVHELPTKVDKLPFYDFNTNAKFEGVYFATDPAGHYFGDVAPTIMMPCTDDYKTVNIALTADLKGKKVVIEYLGFNEEEKRGLFEVSVHE